SLGERNRLAVGERGLHLDLLVVLLDDRFDFLAQLLQAAAAPGDRGRAFRHAVHGEAQLAKDAPAQAVLHLVQTNALLAQAEADLVVADRVEADDVEEHEIAHALEGALQGIHLQLLDGFAHGSPNQTCMPYRVRVAVRIIVAPKGKRAYATCTGTPGLIVEQIVIDLTKCPLTPDGLAARTASMKELMFSVSFFSSKLILPTPACTLPPLSVRNSTLPALKSLTAPVTSPVMTVPALGVGIRPRGPSTLPRRLTLPIMSCVASATSKSSQPSFCTRSISSSPPAKSAPACFALATLSPCVKTTTRLTLPRPCGSGTEPRII